MNNVINIGDLRFTRKPRDFFTKGCKHPHTTLHADGEYVMCDDCNKQISLYYALSMLIEYWSHAKQEHKRRDEAIREAEGRQVHLRAAQRLERAWRSRKMVPTCPHCNEPIFPTDGFGGSTINKEIAISRRKAKKNTHDFLEAQKDKPS